MWKSVRGGDRHEPLCVERTQPIVAADPDAAARIFMDPADVPFRDPITVVVHAKSSVLVQRDLAAVYTDPHAVGAVGVGKAQQIIPELGGDVHGGDPVASGEHEKPLTVE